MPVRALKSETVIVSVERIVGGGAENEGLMYIDFFTDDAGEVCHYDVAVLIFELGAQK